MGETCTCWQRRLVGGNEGSSSSSGGMAKGPLVTCGAEMSDGGKRAVFMPWAGNEDHVWRTCLLGGRGRVHVCMCVGVCVRECVSVGSKSERPAAFPIGRAAPGRDRRAESVWPAPCKMTLP